MSIDPLKNTDSSSPVRTDAAVLPSQRDLSAFLPTLFLWMLGVAAVGIFATLFLLLLSPRQLPAERQVTLAYEMLQRGEPRVAAAIAERIVLAETDGEYVRQQQAYLVALGRSQAALESGDDLAQRRVLLSQAVDSWEVSRSVGFPKGKSAEAQLMLGRVYHQLGRHKAAAQDFQKALRENPSYSVRWTPDYLESAVRAELLSVEDALAQWDQYLGRHEYAYELVPKSRYLAVDLLRRSGEYHAALERLQRLREQHNELARAQEYQAREAMIHAGFWIEHWKRDSNSPSGPAEADSFAWDSNATQGRLSDLALEGSRPIALQAELWLGRMLEARGASEAALASFSKVAHARPFEATAILATLEAAELLHRQGRNLEVLQMLQHAARELDAPGAFDPDAMSLQQLRAEVLGLVERIVQQREFGLGVRIANALPPLVTKDQAAMLKAEAYFAWATDLQSQFDLASSSTWGMQSKARERYGQAGAAFQEAAELRFEDPEYVGILWRAIDAYEKGNQFRRSLVVLEDYLRYEQHSLRPRGLMAKSRASVAIGNREQALRALEECIRDYPRDATTYDARLLLGMMQSESGQWSEATATLLANIEDGRLGPSSPTFRDSLFELGEALHLQAERLRDKVFESGKKGRLGSSENGQVLATFLETSQHAVDRLEEAAERYPGHHRGRHCRFLAAETYHWFAAIGRQIPATAGLLPSQGSAVPMSRSEHLDQALTHYQGLIEDLQLVIDRKHAIPLDEMLFRNSYLGAADTLVDMQRWEPAANQYGEMSLRFANHPISLEALLGQASCLTRMGRKSQAALLVERARALLQRLPVDRDEELVATTRFDRRGWENYLGVR